MTKQLAIRFGILLLCIYFFLISPSSFAGDNTDKYLEDKIENAGIGVFDASIATDGGISVIAIPPFLRDEEIRYAVRYTLTKFREKYPNGFTTVYCYDANKVLRAEGSISLVGNIKVKIK